MQSFWRRSLVVVLVLAACTVYNIPEGAEVPTPRATDSVLVSTPVKAHLLDGSTVVYPAGIRVVRDTVRGSAIGVADFRYGLTLKDSAPATPIPLDSVLGFETFRDVVNTPASVVLTLFGTAGTVLGGAVLAVAIFGSCPTVYSDSAGTPTLEAEGFSYSIAPLFEARDVDRLRGVPDSVGAFRLEVRNEALETHYINQLGMLQVFGGPSETIVPTPTGQPVAVRDIAPPSSARDRAGRDVRGDLTQADGRTFATATTVLDQVTAEDPADAIDLTFPRVTGQDSAVLVIRLRNSLLNTVLLYDLMLADPGLRALDWVGHDLQRVGPATRLGQWYSRNFGLRISVLDHGQMREVGRAGDTGPIAWKDVAVTVPVPRDEDSLHIRLSFVADDWRIDRVGLAGTWRHTTPRVLTPVLVSDSEGRADTAALASLQGADTRYLVTQPGNRFFLGFAPAPAPPDSVSTFLLVSQGYYIEWLRGSWVQPHLTGASFQPTNDALVDALHRWRRRAPEFERRFYATRFPVR